MSKKMRELHSNVTKLETYLTSHLNHALDQSLDLTMRDWCQYKDAILLWLCYILDLGVLSINDTNVWRVLKNICETPCTVFISTLKTLDTSLIKYVRDSKSVSYAGFKRRLENSLAVSIASLFKNVFSIGDVPEIFKKCHTSFVFMSRLTLRDRDDLQVEARETYVRENDHISLGAPEEASIMRQWFPRKENVLSFLFSKTYKFVGHGPGTTADAGRLLMVKTKSMKLTQKQHYFLNRLEYYGIKREECPLEWLLGRFSNSEKVSISPEDNIAKVVFVPKSADKLRTICMEPSGTMFLEQGAMRAILAFITRKGHPLRRRIDLEDQSLNRDLAWVGSVDGSFATIDLSAASDSVSWELIAHWSASTALREMLYSLRTEYFNIESDEYHSNRFAPMGSALCFPLECIVFCAIVEAALRGIGVDPDSSEYRTYGDDIVVESQYASAVIAELQRNGFRVNESKSYFDLPGECSHIYRESCGGEYLDGVDVTPCRLSRRFLGFNNLRKEPSAVEGLVELANELFTCKLTRSVILRKMKEHLPLDMMPLFDNSGETGIFSPAPTNFDRKRRENLDYQRTDIIHKVPGIIRCSEDDGIVAYLATLQALDRTNRKSLVWPDDRISVDTTLSSRKGWVTQYTAEYR